MPTSKSLVKSGADTGTPVLAVSGNLTGFSFIATDATDTLKLYNAAAATAGTEILVQVGSGSGMLPSVQFGSLYRVQLGASSTSCVYVAD